MRFSVRGVNSLRVRFLIPGPKDCSTEFCDAFAVSVNDTFYNLVDPEGVLSKPLWYAIT